MLRGWSLGLSDQGPAPPTCNSHFVQLGADLAQEQRRGRKAEVPVNGPAKETPPKEMAKLGGGGGALGMVSRLWEEWEGGDGVGGRVRF